MRLSDAMKPAMEWSEAAMLPARPRTLSGGAALGQCRQVDGLDTARVEENGRQTPVPTRPTRSRALGRAAYRQVRSVFQRANNWVTYTKP